jgi:archaemetzincin
MAYMKPGSILLAILFAVLFSACSPESNNFLREKNKQIALQPVGDFDTILVAYLQKELSAFYQRKVIVLETIPEPNSAGWTSHPSLVMADSIISLVSVFNNDTIGEVVGLSHKGLLAAKEGQDGPHDSPTPTKNVLGLSYTPGNTCVVSDHNLFINDWTLGRSRVLKVIIHEIGHNLGLAHCKYPYCIMSENNGYIGRLDAIVTDYCPACKRKLGLGIKKP